MAGAALRNTEALYNQLLQNPSDVVTDAVEAAEIWKLFRKYPIDHGRLEPLSYRAFLQAALMAAIDGSEAMGWVETIWRASVKPGVTARKVLKKVAQHALKRYYRHLKGEPEQLYATVLSGIHYQCAHYFRSIEQGVEI